MITKHFFFFIFLTLFTFIITDNKNLQLNIETTGKLKEDDYEFYSLKLDSSLDKHKYNLVVRVFEDSGNADAREDFSDVDVYISTSNLQPKSPSTSSWYSERYGDDIITINKEHIEPNRTFHIGVYCQFQCNYKLKAYLSEILDIQEGKINSYLLSKKSSITFKFHTKVNYDHLSFAFISPQMKPFKLYIAKNNPSSQNTFKLEPSWISGYTLDIKKGDSRYCENCDYFIVAESQEQDVSISMIVTYPGTELMLRPSEQIFDHVTVKGRRCYKYKINELTADDAIVTNIVLFSGTAIVQVHGYDSNVEMNYSTIPYDDFTYEISSEQVITIDAEDLKELRDSKNNNNTSSNSNTSNDYYHFCVYGKERASYLVGTHLASESETLQRLNYLLMGQQIMGYIPKGQVTKYRVFDFSKDSNVTISLDSIEGNSQLYILFTEDLRKSFYNKERLFSELNTTNPNPNLHQADKTFTGYEKHIANTDNICHQKVSSSKNLEDELKKMSCGLYAIVYCSDEQTNCIYRLRAKTNKSSQLLVPRTTLYNIISKDDIDSFTFNIDDEDIETVSVVLNTISGQTILQVNDATVNPQGKTIEISALSYYLPNVVQLTSNKVGRNNLKGKYIVEVKAKSFSTYSIYYYTRKKEHTPTTPALQDVELRLELGEIEEGFFNGNTQYKIYMFKKDTYEGESRDYIFSLTKRNAYFMMYVFTDLNKFKLNNAGSNELISGYTWKGGYNNEIVISKNDTNYTKTGPYYIVVSRERIREEFVNVTETFYIGVTDDKTAFLLYEGTQHLATLTQNYTHQSYIYYHTSTKSKFNLGVNIFFGRVNIYVDFNEITRDRIINNKQQLYQVNEDEYDSIYITIPSDDLKERCKTSKNCPIYIYVEKKSMSSAQYLLIAKSKSKRPFLLNSGIITENSMLIKEQHYYIIEHNQAKKSGYVLVKFNEGSGHVYMNLVKDVTINEELFPTETNYTYKGNDTYQGKIIQIESLELEQCEPSCKYLITVIGSSLGYQNSFIYYSITYSNDAKQIHQNIPLHDEIKAGEMHYYRTYFDDTATSLYLSLYCSNGDADIYMNYGETLPTSNDYHWMSVNPQMDFIAFDVNDPFFVGKQKKTLKGYYTILILGHTSATYTLFVTSHPNRIIPLSNNKPGTCQCKEEGAKCFFRFDELIPYYDQTINDVSIVFSTNYLYGSGVQYVKLYKETDFDIREHFPTEYDHEWSNKDKNKRNFLKVDISKSNPNLTKNSMLLITVDCKEKSLLEMNSAKITKSSYQYLDSRRENLFYLEKSTQPTTLSFYYQQDKNLDFEFFTFTGKADVLVYQNNTSYNPTTQKYEVFYTHISSFQVEKGKAYYNFLRKNSDYLNKNIYFKVTPKENIGFYVKLNYEEEWTRVDVGKSNSYQINSGTFYGYFDLLQEYEDSVISIFSKDKLMKAHVYITVNIYERIGRNSEGVNPFNLKIPNTNTYDYKGVTDSFGRVSIKLPPVPKNVYENKFVRVLFKVQTVSSAKVNRDIEQTIDVLITPTVNNIRRIEANPLRLYFSNAQHVNAERTIFDLQKIRKNDDIFVIQLSTCTGRVGFAFTNQITYFGETSTSIPDVQSRESNGKVTITAYNMTESDYYLSVWGIEDNRPCFDPTTCTTTEGVEYLLYYYTTQRSRYHSSKINELLVPIQTGRNKVEIIVGKLEQKDVYGNVQKVENINFKPFVSTNPIDYLKMGSLCYLAKLERIPKGMKYYYDKAKEVFVLSGFDTNVMYAINLLIENPQTNELFVFTPARIKLNYFYNVSGFMIVVLICVIVALSVAVLYFYKKYKLTKTILKYERNDLHSMGNLPEISSEMANVHSERVKYSTLTSEPSSI